MRSDLLRVPNAEAGIVSTNRRRWATSISVSIIFPVFVFAFVVFFVFVSAVVEVRMFVGVVSVVVVTLFVRKGVRAVGINRESVLRLIE